MIEHDETPLGPHGATASDPTELLIAAVYEELRRLAYRSMAREAERPTLQPTALVHEAYLRLRAEGAHGWANRAQFFAAAATAMRRILMERARRRRALRHGGAGVRVELEVDGLLLEADRELLELEVALEHLRALDAGLFELVNLRYFAGMTCEEAAAVLGASPRTLRRDWETARLFLFERIRRLRAEGNGRRAV